MERPALTGLNKEQEEYISFLEGSLYGTTNLLRELSLFSDVCSEDMELIRLGDAAWDGSNLKYIKSDKDDIVFNRIMLLLAKVKELQAVEKMMSENSKAPVKAKKEQPVRNIQELSAIK